MNRRAFLARAFRAAAAAVVAPKVLVSAKARASLTPMPPFAKAMPVPSCDQGGYLIPPEIAEALMSRKPGTIMSKSFVIDMTPRTVEEVAALRGVSLNLEEQPAHIQEFADLVRESVKRFRESAA